MKLSGSLLKILILSLFSLLRKMIFSLSTILIGFYQTLIQWYFSLKYCQNWQKVSLCIFMIFIYLTIIRSLCVTGSIQSNMDWPCIFWLIPENFNLYCLIILL